MFISWKKIRMGLKKLPNFKNNFQKFWNIICVFIFGLKIFQIYLIISLKILKIIIKIFFQKKKKILIEISVKLTFDLETQILIKKTLQNSKTIQNIKLNVQRRNGWNRLRFCFGDEQICAMIIQKLKSGSPPWPWVTRYL